MSRKKNQTETATLPDGSESTLPGENGSPVNNDGASSNGSAKPKEPKDVRFKRLASRRVSVALKRLQHVANLGNRNQYEYTKEQADRIMAALNEQLLRVKAAFADKADTADLFTL